MTKGSLRSRVVSQPRADVKLCAWSRLRESGLLPFADDLALGFLTMACNPYPDTMLGERSLRRMNERSDTALVDLLTACLAGGKLSSRS